MPYQAPQFVNQNIEPVPVAPSLPNLNRGEVISQALEGARGVVNTARQEMSLFERMVEDRKKKAREEIDANFELARKQAEERRLEEKLKRDAEIEKKKQEAIQKAFSQKQTGSEWKPKQQPTYEQTYGEQGAKDIRELESGIMPEQQVTGYQLPDLEEVPVMGPRDRNEMAQILTEGGALNPNQYFGITDPTKDPEFLMQKAQASKGMGFEERAQLEMLKEDLRAGRPLNEWQKQLLQLRAEELGLKREGMGIQREGLGIRKERLGLEKEDQKRQDAGRLTSFVKNTKDQAEILYAYQDLDRLIPGGIYGSGGVAGFGFGTKPFRKFWKSDEANSIRPGIQSLINKVLKQRSGAAVTDQELDRLNQEFGINTWGTIEEFRKGLQNFYEGVKNDYDRFVTADPTAAQKIDRQGYGTLQNNPQRIQQQRPQQAPPQKATWTNDQERILQQKKAQLAKLRAGKP